MRLVTLLLCILTGSAAYIFHLGNTNHKPDLFGIADILIQNNSPAPLPLYSKNNSQRVVHMLAPGEAIPFLYTGTTGKWFYGRLANQEVIFKDEHRAMAIRVKDLVFPLLQLRDNSAYASAFMFCCFAGLNINARRKRKQTSRLQEQAAQEAAYRQKALANENIKLKQKVAELENTQHTREQYSLQEKQQLLAMFEAQKRQLHMSIEREAEKRTNVKLSEMQASLDRINSGFESLKETHRKCIEDCKIFDIDFQSSDYENILKGRKFEIYFARQILENPDMEILEWTSDKGFENGIRVKANGNPDFVIGYKQQKFAVECKYRSSHFRRNGVQDSISWCSSWQNQRYRQFGEERGIRVYLALGCHDLPEQPQLTYFVEHQTLIDLSKPVTINNNDQLLVSQARISRYLLPATQFPTKILDIISED